MHFCFFIAAIAFLLPAYVRGQAAPNAAAAAADNLAIHRLLDQYAQAVDTVDLKLLAQIWSHSPDAFFIYLWVKNMDSTPLSGMSSRR